MSNAEIGSISVSRVQSINGLGKLRGLGYQNKREFERSQLFICQSAQFRAKPIAHGRLPLQMKTLRTVGRILLCLAPLLLVGCAATLQYPPFPDQAKKIEDPGKARVYVMRKEKFFGSAVAIQFFGSGTDGIATGPIMGRYPKKRLIGEIGPASYICWDQPPGPFVFATIENDPHSTETLHLEAGKVYYLLVFIHSVWTTATVRSEGGGGGAGGGRGGRGGPPGGGRRE